MPPFSPAVTPAPMPAPDTRLVIPTQGPSTGLRTVVIDPGHGGDELGTQGARGTLEKEITLSVARRLRTLIETRLGAIRRIDETAQHFFVSTTAGLGHVIPKRDLESLDAIRALRSRVTKGKGAP